MMMKNLKSIPEVIDRSQFIQRVLCLSIKSPSIAHSIPVNKLKLALEGGIMTYLLHWLFIIPFDCILMSMLMKI